MTRFILAFGLFVLSATTSFAAVINGVFENSNTSFVKDAGVLSSPGGTVWNSIGNAFNGIPDLRDQFGAATATDFKLTGGDGGVTGASATPFGTSTNSSAGSGAFTTDAGESLSFQFSDLILGATYELAIYLGNDRFSPAIDNLSVTGAGGTVIKSSTGANPLNLPGTAGVDYLLFQNIVALDLGGTAGITFSLNGGSLTGFQISGNFNAPVINGVPEPGAPLTWLMLAAVGALAAKRRRLQ